MRAYQSTALRRNWFIKLPSIFPLSPFLLRLLLRLSNETLSQAHGTTTASNKNALHLSILNISPQTQHMSFITYTLLPSVCPKHLHSIIDQKVKYSRCVPNYYNKVMALQRACVQSSITVIVSVYRRRKKTKHECEYNQNWYIYNSPLVLIVIVSSIKIPGLHASNTVMVLHFFDTLVYQPFFPHLPSPLLNDKGQTKFVFQQLQASTAVVYFIM